MALTLYELAGENSEIRFSPHCWKIRMALAHKGVDAKRIPWRFTEKEEIAFSGQAKVPVLIHDKNIISDSWAIATYLDDTFKDTPSLFSGSEQKSLSLFLNNWADTVLLPSLARLILTDIHSNLAPCDRGYFRETREKRFGQKLEDISSNRDIDVHAYRKLLTPLRASLQSQPYLSGKEPLYADYCVFGLFMWARCVSDFELLEADDPINQWQESLLDAFGGYARKAPRPTTIGEIA